MEQSHTDVFSMTFIFNTMLTINSLCLLNNHVKASHKWLSTLTRLPKYYWLADNLLTLTRYITIWYQKIVFFEIQ